MERVTWQDRVTGQDRVTEHKRHQGGFADESDRA